MCIARIDDEFKKGQAMTDSYNDRQTSDSRDSNAKDASQTSGSREESMKESGDDVFGENARRDRKASSQADGSKSGEQDPASSGTTPLSGDTADSNDRQGPGGVEGTGSNT